ncbi:class I SAM-dependent methyltransferase [Bradyrhizobium sp. SEMIA]|uniref:class I SAM-dependent methyltransferase n=1 Tax=Bradyrhizobium sp. SEMIA TaxID=2597515 RepID=UPI0018A668C6|nr:class I SAM-dependent methyltransferase [Bradyrhizobium sp. SEMIA]QOG17180.1 methyltransferase domain-containing protein [Bradyrhizobium sp. SEMIA]
MNNSAVHDYWNEAACGEAAYAVGIEASERFSSQRETRYELEPFIRPFARFEEGHRQDVLEIGVGMGADHEQWARSGPARLCGIDLTPRAVDLTRERLALANLQSELQVADAERLPFPDATFDIVYSWGVLHHSAETPQAFKEVARVLKPGGIARVMIYHKWSLVGVMLWLRYGGFSSNFASIYAKHLESPGTKAYSTREAAAMVEACGLRVAKMEVQLSPGDLLSGATGQRHRGRLLSIARRLWPRRILRSVARPLGLYLMIEAIRPSE